MITWNHSNVIISHAAYRGDGSICISTQHNIEGCFLTKQLWLTSSRPVSDLERLVQELTDEKAFEMKESELAQNI